MKYWGGGGLWLMPTVMRWSLQSSLIKVWAYVQGVSIITYGQNLTEIITL